MSNESSRAFDGAVLEMGQHGHEEVHGLSTSWFCEKWEQDKIDHVMRQMDRDGRIDSDFVPHHLGGKTIYRPRADGLPSDFLRDYGVSPDEEIFVPGNLLLNEGIGRLLDLLCVAGGVGYNNANAYVGVGDSVTAEAASQTELAAASNRFYKAMNATFPTSPGSNGAQSRDWRSDFTTTEANYAWAEWTICAGATTASGAGFTSGTTNLNRKVQALGTKTTGTWTLTGTVTIS